MSKELTKPHKLKTVQPYFNEVWEGRKTFEIRLNDRDFQLGDVVHLQEYDVASDKYSGREVYGCITYILSDYGPIHAEHIVFSFRELSRSINQTL